LRRSQFTEFTERVQFTQLALILNTL